MNDTQVIVGMIVHVIHQQRCYPAIVVRVDDDGARMAIINANDEQGWNEQVEPYVALKSARPTSGWHHLSEHD